MASTVPSLVDETVTNMIKLLKLLAQESVHIRIVLALARKGCLSLRGVAREVGMAPKNVKKYLEDLENLGIVTCIKPSRKMFLYRLSDQYSWLQDLIKSLEGIGTNHHEGKAGEASS